MTDVRLTALIPNYNHARFLPETLEGVLSQLPPSGRVIVIDDCSTDDSLEVLRGYAARHAAVTLLQNPRNMGVVWTMNRLLGLAESEYVYFGAADDRLLPGFFAKCVAMLDRHPQAGICSANSLLMDEDSRLIGHVGNRNVCDSPCHISPEAAAELIRDFSDVDLWICGNASVYRRQALVKSGGFNERLEFYCDGFLHKLISLRDGACYLPEFLAVSRVTANNYSTTVANDAARLLRVRQVAYGLMTNEFKDVFPDWYKQFCREILDRDGDAA